MTVDQLLYILITEKNSGKINGKTVIAVGDDQYSQEVIDHESDAEDFIFLTHGSR